MLREMYQHERLMQRELVVRLGYVEDDRQLMRSIGSRLLQAGQRALRLAGELSVVPRAAPRELEHWRA